MRKEVWVDCTQQDLEDLAIELDANGIKGKSKRRVKTLPENSIEVELRSREDLEKLRKYVDKVPYIIASCPNWKVIPVENLVQITQWTRTKCIIRTNDVKEAEVYAGALDLGVDGFLVSDPKVIKDFCSLYKSLKLPLIEAEVTKVRAARKAARACVDLTDILNKREGLLLGSSINFMMLIDAETMENPFVDKRDFRINAGSVANRVFRKPGSTPYLRDLSGGDDLLVVDYEGNTKRSDIERILIEKRPLIYVEAVFEGRIGKVYLQNAETVKAVTPSGYIRMDKISEGDIILGYAPPIKEYEGRHLGEEVKEFFLEK